jgi:hypothetical protein
MNHTAGKPCDTRYALDSCFACVAVASQDHSWIRRADSRPVHRQSLMHLFPVLQQPPMTPYYSRNPLAHSIISAILPAIHGVF